MPNNAVHKVKAVHHIPEVNNPMDSSDIATGIINHTYIIKHCRLLMIRVLKRYDQDILVGYDQDIN